MKLHSEVVGAGPVSCVFLHGLLGDGANLRRLAGLCVSDGAALLMDLRNHGRSAHEADMSWECMARDVIDTLDAHQLGSCHLVGHSLGGKVAMAVAEHFADRVRSLAVLDIAPVQYESSHEMIFKALHSLEVSVPASREDARQRLLQCLSDETEVNFLLKNLQRDESGALRLRCDLAAIMAAYTGLRSSPLNAPARYSGPVCFLKGGRSAYIDEPAQKVIARLYPGSSRVVIPDAGHWLHFEQAEAVAASLHAFWSDQGLSNSW